MPRNVCCVPGCPVVADDGIPLHYFPNPEKEAAKFQKWIKSIGGGIASLDSNTVYKTRRICRRHFQDVFLYPKNRLCKLAVPSLHLPSEDQASAPRISPFILDNPPSTSHEATLVHSNVILEPASANAVQNEPCISAPRISPFITHCAPSTSHEATLVHSNVILEPASANTVQNEPCISAPRISPFITHCAPSTSHEATLVHSNVILEPASANTVQNEPCISAPSMDLFYSSSQPSTSQRATLMRPMPARTVKNKPCCSVTSMQWKQENQIKKMELRLRRCLKDKQTFRKRYLLAKKISKSSAFEMITKNMSRTAKTLFNMQVKDGGKKPRGRRFTLDEKILALSLYKPSPKAYRLLSKLCVLPSRRTLQNVLQKVDLVPGINENIFQHLKKRVSRMPKKHKYCSILFDEMSIAPALTFDKSHDKITGFVDTGTKREQIFSDHVLVFMVRGIVKKYKQPIAYSFCSGTTKTADLKFLLKQIIEKVQTTGLKVIATICDQGSTNIAAINQLMQETKATYLRRNEEFRGGFFEVTGCKIVPIYDPPHLIKGIRNNLLNKNLKFTMDGKVRVAKWSHIENLYHRSPTFRGVKLVHKLTALHVVPSMIPKMKVKYCTQVFSKSVGVTLGCMAEDGSLPKDSVDTAELIMLLDDLFDSVNANFHRAEGKIYKSAVTPNSPHVKFWNSTLPILKSMRFVIDDDKETTVPSLTSWVKTIEGFKSIVTYLWSQGINSILLRNMNQDPLENFFGAIRAHGYNNIMPSSTAFENAFKTLLINNITSAHSIQGNCEEDDSFCLQSLKSLIVENESPSNNNTDGNEIRQINDYHLNIEMIDTTIMLQSRSRVNVEKCAAIAYCSGWMATKAKKFVFKKCNTCKINCISENIEDFHKYITKKEYCGKKWLCYPSRALFDYFAQVEHITLEILKTDAHMVQIIQYITLIVTLHIDFNFLTCKEHKNTLNKYLLNKSVTFFVMNWCREVSNVLTGKSFYNFIEGDCNEMDSIIVQAREHFNKRNGRKRERQTGVVLSV